jgi:hypothetical protein
MTDRPIWPQGTDRPMDTPPAPSSLFWDLWLGPAPARPYHPAYLPFRWRGWWDFGTGALGDMACHLVDGAFWALNLSHPISIEAEGEPRHPHSAPKWSTVRYQFPARGRDLPPVALTWYDGGKTIPTDLLDGITLAKGFNGSLFVGDKGKLLAEHGGSPRLLPEATFKDAALPPSTLPPSPGHYKEWIEACKTGVPGTTGSTFDYACPMTEAVLLGNVAFRVGQRLDWDAGAMKARNCSQADEFLWHRYRRGYTL